MGKLLSDAQSLAKEAGRSSNSAFFGLGLKLLDLEASAPRNLKEFGAEEGLCARAWEALQQPKQGPKHSFQKQVSPELGLDHV